MGQRIVVIGAGVAGLTAALELRANLGQEHTVTVVSREPEFLFRPSLIWVPFGLRTEASLTFPLAPLFENAGVEFRCESVTALDLDARRVITGGGEEPYDLLVIASGAEPAWEAVAGLDPLLGRVQSISTYRDAEGALVAFERLLLEPGDVVVGSAGASADLATAYEFALNLAYQLRKKGPRAWRRMTFVTPEPYVGHLGLDGVGPESELTERLLTDRGIDAVTNAKVREVTDSEVVLDDGRRIPFRFCQLAPPLRAPAFVRSQPRLVDAGGFVKVDDQLRNPAFPEVFAAGSSVGLPSRSGEGLAPPKGGHMSDVLGRLVARNVVATVEGKPLLPVPAGGVDLRLNIDAGDRGLLVMADRLGAEGERTLLVPGREAHWAKLVFEQYYLATRRRGWV